MKDKIDTLDWSSITEDMHSNGYAIVSKILTSKQCEEIIQLYEVQAFVQENRIDGAVPFRKRGV